jgi:hypothetical protein
MKVIFQELSNDIHQEKLKSNNLSNIAKLFDLWTIISEHYE